jgi:hypothetical protein
MADAIESIKLSEVLRLVPKPKYVLGTTYTLSLAFFESVVFPFIDRSNLKACLILCDMDGYQRALTEAAALQSAAEDYMVLPAPVSGCFHPKVWLAIGEDQAVLLVGSGNLTQAGFMTNAELFDALHFTPASPLTPEMLRSIRSFTAGLTNMWPDEDRQHLLCVETLARIEEALSALPVNAAANGPTPLFLHSFGQSLIEQMPAIPDASDLYVAAPYFANSLKGLDLLATRYPKARLHVFPAVHGGRATDIPLKQLKGSYLGVAVSRLSAAPKNTAFAHLKLYGVARGGDTAWLCCASANCTQAAWQGPNVEAGLLRQVQPSTLPAYFVPDPAKLPEESVSAARPLADSVTVHCWASDTGVGIDIAVPSSSSKLLPWHDVTLTVRAGSAFATCNRQVLFQNSPSTHLHWASFAGWKRRRNIAVWLELDGKDANAARVRASCFVEDRLQLTAEPVHRSALRGALALLDPEGAPDLADVSAIFTLADSLFDGTLLKHPTPPPGDGGKQAPADDKDATVSVALWPPEAHTHELQRKIGQTATGQLRFFHRILRTLLNAVDSDDTPQAPENNLLATQDDDDEDAEDAAAESRRVEQETKARDDAEQMWRDAQHNYDRLYDRLTELCPTVTNAKNVWPAAIYSFLSILATLKAAKRLMPELRFSPLTVDCCDGFLWVMLHQRRQDEDFCCPKHFRYRSSKFPALANDLLDTFNIRPHPDLALLPLALLVDKRMRTEKDLFPKEWAVHLSQLYEDTFVPDAGTRDASRRLWRHYVCDRKAPDAEFDKSFHTLFAPRLAGTPR